MTTFAQGPGGITTNLRWWLKSNAQVRDNGGNLASNNEAVANWDDQSTQDNDALQGTNANRPIYRTGRINGYPTLQFSGDQFLIAETTPGIASNGSFIMFLVLKQDSYALGTPNDADGSFIIDRTPETNGLMSFKMVTGNKYNYQKRNDSNGNLGGPISNATAPTGVFTIVDFYRIYGSSFGIYLDGIQDVTENTNTNDAITGPTIQIGRHAVQANNGLRGELAEVILYNASLTTANRRQVESYLAIKYGITLDPSTPQSYFSSTNNIFPVSTDANFTPYRYDVAGIIEDDNAAIDQETSHSQNTDYVVTVSNPSSLGNGDALVWGSNNESLTTPNTVDVDGTIVKRRLSRVWRFEETGSPGTVTISFDLSSVPETKSQADLRLLIDTDDNGFADNDFVQTGTLVGNTITFTNVNLNDDDNVTIGSTDIGSTPLPVELVGFNVTYDKPIVNASWRTATELNNDFFTLERSINGSDFIAVDTVEGNGTTSTQQTYTATDYFPIEGTSYYRLKQTDFDGTVDYSGLQVVLVENLENTLNIFPNPTDDSKLNISLHARELSVHSIEMIDLQGKVAHAMYFNFIRTTTGSCLYDFPDDIADGIYILRVRYNDKIEHHKVLLR